MTVSGHIHYDPPSLLGFARMQFSTDSAHYRYLNYGDYVAEFEAVFPSGKVSVDVFELKTSGHYK